ncbi:MAG: hypothetical protein WC357_08600 [Candidatus Omnitrophota bacterium]|jgi:hypothetical protein
MQESKKITDQVNEKLTMGQIERIWQQVDVNKKDDPNRLSLQVFWLAGVEVWVVNEGGVITMMFPNEEV